MSSIVNSSSETRKNNLASVVPQCMKDLPRVNYSAKPLGETEAKAAQQDLINHAWLKYPKQRLLRNDPSLPNQIYAIHSFMPSMKATPDPDGCYGVLKIRGIFATEREADECSERLIRDVDSYNEIVLSKVGQEIPLTNDDKFCNETKEINLREKVDETAKAYIKQKRIAEKQEMKECTERVQRLNTDPAKEKEDALDELELYTNLQVKQAGLRSRLDECRKMITDSQILLTKTTKELQEQDKVHPEFRKQYKEKYNKGLQDAGVRPADNPIVNYFDADADDDDEKKN